MDTNERVVKKLLKVDFHIHSVESTKDGKKVEFNTLDNIEILVKKLKENEIDMVSITDHNNFSYNFYQKLKSFEGEKIKKVLPGIEFDVEFEKKRIHFLTIFSDDNKKKLKKIKKIIERETFDNTESNAYSEKTFKEMLKKIDLNVLLIAHQKNDVRAENQGENLAQIGEEKFDEVIGIDYFDAVEFRSGKVEGMLKDYKVDKELVNLRYITGTDCHDWSVYPRQDPNDTGDVKFSYLKCLPTFKGLVMALTEQKRVTTEYYPIPEPFVSQIDLKIGNEDISVPLSYGLNVIIGDNSIGKSLILNKLLEGKNDKITTSIKNGYSDYLKKRNMNINPFDKKIIEATHYDYQGRIRDLFQSGTKLLDIPYFKSKFLELNTDLVAQTINNYAKRVVEKIKKNQTSLDIDFGLDFDIVIPSEIEDNPYSLRILDELKIENHEYQNIINNFNIIIQHMNKFEKMKEFEDYDEIKIIKEKLNKLLDKYKNKLEHENNINSIKAIIKKICIEYENDNIERAQEQDNIITEFKQNIILAKSKILDKIADTNKEKYKILENFQTINVNIANQKEGEYVFVTKTLVDKISNKIINNILTYPLKNLNDIEKVENYSIQDFKNKLKKDVDIGDDFEKNYLNAVAEYVNKEVLKQETVILQNEKDVTKGNSQGKNALIYLDVLAGDQTSKIYVADQPDDDISHLKINKELIRIMRKMVGKKQVLFITHKAELVVNLDVDNVISIKEENNKLIINSGALEYENRERNINILRDVAELLDGGADTIRKRWKRYDKQN